MKKIKLLLFGIVVSISLTQTAPYVQNGYACANQYFLTMPTWYRGVVDGDCNVSVESAPDLGGGNSGGQLGGFILTIAMNVVEMLMQLAAMVCIAFIIVGGYRYIISAGSPDGNVKGRKTIINALIGLVISIMAIAFVEFVIRRG